MCCSQTCHAHCKHKCSWEVESVSCVWNCVTPRKTSKEFLVALFKQNFILGSNWTFHNHWNGCDRLQQERMTWLSIVSFATERIPYQHSSSWIEYEHKLRSCLGFSLLMLMCFSYDWWMCIMFFQLYVEWMQRDDATAKFLRLCRLFSSKGFVKDVAFLSWDSVVIFFKRVPEITSNFNNSCLFSEEQMSVSTCIWNYSRSKLNLLKSKWTF